MSNSAPEHSGKIFDKYILSRLFTFAKPYMGRFYLLVALTFVGGVLAPLRPILIQYTIDHHVSVSNFKGLLQMTWLMLGLLVLQSVVQYYQTYLSGWIGQTIIHDIRIKLYRHILSLRLKFFDNTQIGRLVTRNISDIETLSDVFTEGLAAMAGDILQLIFILAFMFYTDWRLTLMSLATLPLLLLSTYVFKEKIKETFNDARTAVANLNTFVQEHITGMSIVQMFGSEDREYQKFKAINREHRQANMRSVLYYSIYFPVAEVIGAISTGLLVWFGARTVLHDEATLGTLIAFIMYITMFFRPIRMIADRFNTLQMGIVSTDRIVRLLDTQESTPDNGTLAPAQLHGAVRLDNVWFAYNNEDYILKNISFEINAGETLALVGATGAGKSSIINLLNRSYEINQGQISIDGIDIRAYKLDYLRSKIGVVLQDVFLFSGSIEQNISLGNPAITREQIMQAADLVGARRFIERLPGGLDYNVMERGATLSVGQRQLISFIRAMVYDPKIIILDEATSSVDSETEALIQAAIEKMMRGRTAIVIAHRLSTIQRANKILVMEKGEIKESGTHQELIARPEGLYRQLHKLQYKSIV